MVTHVTGPRCRTAATLIAVAIATFPLAADGQVLYGDNFDVDTSADWTALSSGDSDAQFAFDYAALGIPPAPGTATTLGLRLRAHLQATTAVHAVTLSSAFRVNSTPADGYRLQFFAWQNHTNLNITPNGLGPTQYLTAGIGHDGFGNNFAGNVSASGVTPPRPDRARGSPPPATAGRTGITSRSRTVPSS